MKSTLTSLFLLLITLFFSACSSKYAAISSKPTYRCAVDNVIAPEWVCKEYMLDGYTSAVGIALYDINSNNQLALAQENAQKNIVNKLNSTKIKAENSPQQLKLWKNSKTKTLYLLYIVKTSK